MNRFVPLVLLTVTAALVAAGCNAAATGPRSERDPAAASPTPQKPSASEPLPSASAVIRIWGAGGAVSFGYETLRAWSATLASEGGGLALVKVVEISPTRWSTASGAAPSAGDLERASRGDIEFTIGRLVTVERVRVLGGAWPLAGARASYWLPGGRLGSDRTPEIDLDLGLSPPRVGGLAVAGMFAGTDLDPTPGELTVNVQQLFPADPSGRVRTLDPAELVTLDSVAAAVAGP